jgi:hypothetical protein
MIRQRLTIAFARFALRLADCVLAMVTQWNIRHPDRRLFPDDMGKLLVRRGEAQRLLSELEARP